MLITHNFPPSCSDSVLESLSIVELPLNSLLGATLLAKRNLTQ